MGDGKFDGVGHYGQVPRGALPAMGKAQLWVFEVSARYAKAKGRRMPIRCFTDGCKEKTEGVARELRELGYPIPDGGI